MPMCLHRFGCLARSVGNSAVLSLFATNRTGSLLQEPLMQSIPFDQVHLEHSLAYIPLMHFASHSANSADEVLIHLTVRKK